MREWVTRGGKGDKRRDIGLSCGGEWVRFAPTTLSGLESYLAGVAPELARTIGTEGRWFYNIPNRAVASRTVAERNSADQIVLNTKIANTQSPGHVWSSSGPKIAT
jgi:hypothetical protein